MENQTLQDCPAFVLSISTLTLHRETLKGRLMNQITNFQILNGISL